MTSQISFIDGQYSLIHIPLALYTTVLQPILQVLLPEQGISNGSHPSVVSENDPDLGDLSLEEDRHGFLNISITPIEASVICYEKYAAGVFQPAIAALPIEISRQISISQDHYEIFSVNSAGNEAGSRVMELTAPLALAGIPIFFITTYFTDFIMVPRNSHKLVVLTLEAGGFAFSDLDCASMVNTPGYALGDSYLDARPLISPPPSNIADLQQKTFEQLRRKNVKPQIVEGLHLVQCSGRELSMSECYRSANNGSNGPKEAHWLDGLNTKLYIALVAALTSMPKFLSVTISALDPPTLLLDKNLLGIFGDTITGDTAGSMVPIFLDLSSLPLESTGIVCGVAGKLVDEVEAEDLAGLSYLSTAKAGAVILSKEGAQRAMEVLLPHLD